LGQAELAEGVLYSGGAVSVADSKGRFVLPLDMRKALRQSSFDDTRLCLSIHKSLDCAIGFGLSHKHWMEEDIAMRERNALDKGLDFDADAERAAAFADIEELNFDDGGRFFLPADIKRMMGIEDAVVLVGVGKYIRLWSPARLLASDSCTPRLRAKVEEFLADPKAGGRK
jgi:MraZ protein